MHDSQSAVANYRRALGQWQDDDGHSDRPSTRSSNEPPEQAAAAHTRSRSTAQSNSSKRLSVFSGRSRSNTTSSSSPRRSPGSSMTSIEDSTPSQDERSGSVLGLHADRPEKPQRSLLSRGSRMLRRQGSKFNIITTLDEENELTRTKSKSERLDTFGRHRAQKPDSHEPLKRLISDPFDFHHLTHTSASHFQSLHQTRQNDLVTEFSAIRASQRAQTDLKGIRAEDIHFRNFSSEELATYGTATTVDGVSRSPPASPVNAGSTSPSHVRSDSRALENFSRPVSRYFRSSPTTPTPPAAADLASSEDAEAPRAIDDVLRRSSTEASSEYIQPNAVSPSTYLDDGTVRSVSMTSHYDLEDVPEEEEATRYWDSPESSLGSHHPRSASQVSHTLPVRTSSRANRKPHLSVVVAKELSRKFSEALGSPTLPQNRTSQNPLMANPSEPHQSSYEDEMYDSWDADIDYCYEHAAESTSNFDWSRTSLDESQRPQVVVACSDGARLAAPSSRQLHPSPLSTSTLPTPDLDPSPARSAPSHSAATPSSAEYEEELVARGAGDYFRHPVSSSILPSPLGKQITQDTLYEDYLAADAESDRHFPFQGIISPAENAVSPRSSFSPISKCNSQESLILSRAASIVRKHRSSVSTTSVPELVYSLSSSRELMAPDLGQEAHAQSTPNLSIPPSHHRQTKSLAEAHLLLQAGSSSASLGGADANSSAAVPFHDRAKSTSEVETPVAARPPIPPMNPNRRKGRTSYSLFPTAAH